MDVSVIVTVLNERESIARLLASLADQTRRPDQVVVCDGGSTDGTVEVVRRATAAYGARLGEVNIIALKDANISEGRNAAISYARGPLIAATDAGVRLDRRWLEQITSPWESCAVSAEEMASAAAGFFVPEADGVFETAMAATVLPAIEDVNPVTFLPSSRSVAFLKDTWEAVGGYPEWLDYCEDLIFDLRVNDYAANSHPGFVWCPDAIAYFRPRSSLPAFWKQYYRYARGDGKADLWRKRHAIRYATYLLALPVLLYLLSREGCGRFLGATALLTGGVAYCWRPWQRLRTLSDGLSPRQRARAAIWVPILRAAGDLAKMIGYPVGLMWRVRNWSRPEIHWRQRSR